MDPEEGKQEKKGKRHMWKGDKGGTEAAQIQRRGLLKDTDGK